MRRTILTTLILVGLLASLAGGADGKAKKRKPRKKKQYWTATDPLKAGPDFLIQGEYKGEADLAAQVIAMGAGRFQAVFYEKALPGEGWTRGMKSERVNSTVTDAGITFAGKQWQGVLKDGALEVKNAQGNAIGALNRIVRQSPTLGLEEPADAIVLFDGSNTKEFQRGRMTDDGLLMEGVTTQRLFGSMRLHLEFRTPFMPTARGQARGNSGCYIHRRYEVQILDSFALDGKHNECGGVYKVKQPDVNVCFPPLSWQTYDIDFTAPQFDGEGKKVKNARLTVRHNGFVIHDDIEVPNKTGSGQKEGPTPGPIYLQNHGNPVWFRNIWVVEK